MMTHFGGKCQGVYTAYTSTPWLQGRHGQCEMTWYTDSMGSEPAGPELECPIFEFIQNHHFTMLT